MAIQVRAIPIAWHPGLSIYASEPFLRSVGDEYGWLGGFDGKDRLRCILPFTIVRKAVIRMVRFRVETISLADDFSIPEEKEFLNAAMENFRARGAGLVIPATTNTIFRTYPDGAVAAPYGTRVVDLQRPEEVLLAEMSSSHRRLIRTAQKSSLQIRSAPELVDLAHAMVRDTFKKSELPFMSLPAFRRYVSGLGENVKILVTEHQGVVQGCIVVPFSRHCAYYVYGGSIPNAAAGAMHLLHWEAMRLFRSLGIAQYDFVGVRINPEKGSKQEGLLAFKERFGGRLVQGYMWKYSINSLEFLLYQLAYRLRGRGDIVEQERHKLAPDTPTNAGSTPATGAATRNPSEVDG